MENIALFIFFLLVGLFIFTLLFFIFSSSLNKNLLKFLFLIELLSLNFSVIFLYTDYYYSTQGLFSINGQLFVLFFLTISALEASIGLAFIYFYFRFWRNININNLNKLKD